MGKEGMGVCLEEVSSIAVLQAEYCEGPPSHQNKVRVPITRYNFFWPSLLAREQGGDRGKWRLADPDLEGQRGKEGVLCPVAYFWVMRDHFLELQSGWRVLLCGRIWGGDSVSIVCLPQ